MADINALIAAGPHTQGIDVRGNALVASRIQGNDRRNQLMDLNIASEPERQARLQAQESRLQSTEDRTQSVYETMEEVRQAYSLSKYLDNNDIQGAIALVSQGGITEKEQPTIDMLNANDPAQVEALRNGLAATLDTSLFMSSLSLGGQGSAQKPQVVAPGSSLVDASGNVVYEGSNQQARTLTADEIAAIPGLDSARAYQQKPDGSITAIGGAGQTINVGTNKAPPGYMWTTDDAGNESLAPIPGGPVARQDVIDETKAIGRVAGIQRAGGTVVQDLGRALELLPEMIQGDGVVGANLRSQAAKIKGTNEWFINEFMDSAKSNIGLDKLQQMRESSPTGGALGQVPIAQQLRLEKVLGRADVGLSPQMMKDNLHRIQNIYFDIMYGSAAERADMVKRGKMTQEDSDVYQSQYHELSFDQFGRTKPEGLTAYEQWKQEQGKP